MKEVEYRLISGYPLYRVGDDGTVWSCRVPRSSTRIGAWRKLKPSSDGSGYQQVWLGSRPNDKAFMVHRLVLQEFVGPCPDGMECLHGDDDKRNCALSNLRWGTKADNMAEAVARGRNDKKLTMKSATEAIRRAASGECRGAVAKEFGITRHYLSQMLRGVRRAGLA